MSIIGGRSFEVGVEMDTHRRDESRWGDRVLAWDRWDKETVRAEEEKKGHKKRKEFEPWIGGKQP